MIASENVLPSSRAADPRRPLPIHTRKADRECCHPLESKRKRGSGRLQGHISYSLTEDHNSSGGLVGVSSDTVVVARASGLALCSD